MQSMSLMYWQVMAGLVLWARYMTVRLMHFHRSSSHWISLQEHRRAGSWSWMGIRRMTANRFRSRQQLSIRMATWLYVIIIHSRRRRRQTVECMNLKHPMTQLYLMRILTYSQQYHLRIFRRRQRKAEAASMFSTQPAMQRVISIFPLTIQCMSLTAREKRSLRWTLITGSMECL